MKPGALLSLATLLFAASGIGAARAVVLGQIDTFESGTTLGWAAGLTQPIVNTGGPSGESDNFLQLTADGSGSSGKLTVFNRAQWLGDYISQGITGIDLDLENLGATPLTIRLAFKSSTANGAPSYLSAGFTLPADATWHHATFTLSAATMTALGSPAAFDTFCSSGIAEMRIINEAGATNSNGDTVTSTLGVDNIQAVPEPNPTTLALLTLLLLLFRIKSPRPSVL
jgi:hypothetical protein